VVRTLGRPAVMARWHEEPSAVFPSFETPRTRFLASRKTASKPRRRSVKSSPRAEAGKNSPVLSIRISPDLDSWLDSQATKERRTVQQIVTHALARYRVEGEMMERLMAERSARIASRRAKAAEASRIAKSSKARVGRTAQRGSRARRGRAARSS